MPAMEETSATFSLPTFTNSALWQQAMTHKSFANEQPTATEHNERLEFLGDAILTFLSAEYLFVRFPKQSEGELTPMRSALVDQSQLHRFAQGLKLDEYLRLGKGAEKEGARKSARLLCSAFEALIGAYFLDQEHNLQLVKDYITPIFESAIAPDVEAGVKDDKTRLQEWAQKTTGSVPEYVEISTLGPDHAKEFVIEVQIGGKSYGRGSGRSKQKAQKLAARSTLEML
ncbi:ribonuclease III [Synechococcus sp. PCC 7335]|uniref:ribonuclease III n=1 Tax=Synechococcus sp. (strain ATCC 29403 / PCC 7335) TaxID=91464 RepID=UPI00017ED5A8|nr:ribonuclease III [Synechococcus sp. PCC 7335]EDX86007.1 ribonuclease III [Synechococcus sp. PCC 7335]